MAANHPDLNRDKEQKPGRPPRPAQEPKGAERSTKTRKTATDPATGEPTGGPDRLGLAKPGH